MARYSGSLPCSSPSTSSGPTTRGASSSPALQTSPAGCSGSSRRLADEARAEGVTSGADTQAAIAVAGRAARIGYRLAAVASGRSATARPPLSESMQTALGIVESAIRESLELALALWRSGHRYWPVVITFSIFRCG